MASSTGTHSLCNSESTTDTERFANVPHIMFSSNWREIENSCETGEPHVQFPTGLAASLVVMVPKPTGLWRIATDYLQVIKQPALTITHSPHTYWGSIFCYGGNEILHNRSKGGSLLVPLLRTRERKNVFRRGLLLFTCPPASSKQSFQMYFLPRADERKHLSWVGDCLDTPMRSKFWNRLFA